MPELVVETDSTGEATGLNDWKYLFASISRRTLKLHDYRRIRDCRHSKSAKAMWTKSHVYHLMRREVKVLIKKWNRWRTKSGRTEATSLTSRSEFDEKLWINDSAISEDGDRNWDYGQNVEEIKCEFSDAVTLQLNSTGFDYCTTISI